MAKAGLFHSFLLACLVNCTMAGLAVAEEVPDLQPGMRVRATIVSESSGGSRSRYVIGILSEIDESAIILRNSINELTLVFPMESVTELEKSIMPGQNWKSIGTGFGIGATLGVFLGLASGGKQGNGVGFDAGEMAGIYGFGVGVLGAIIGATAGPGEQWQKVDIAGASIGFDNSVGNSGCIVVGIRF
jgi:hypothetical protein